MSAMGWEDIRAEVLRRIRTRDWAPGITIPGEEALAQECGVARATVNRALTALAEAGWLERRRKSGTRVAETPVRRATLDIPILRQEVEAQGRAYAFRLLDQRLEVPPLAVATRLGLAPGQGMLWLETVHLADGRPHAHEARWLNPALLPDPAPDFAALSANEWLVRHMAFASGDLAFLAEAASGRVAEVFGLPEGAALLVMERTTWTAEQPITLRRLTHAPGHRVQMMV